MLLIHTALHAEARAVIATFNLKRRHQEHSFACFANGDIWLVESGTGKTNAASAVGWLSAIASADNPVWLNIGMAGHARHDVGTLWLAHRIEDQVKEHRWYPPMLVKNLPMSENLLTVEQPVSDYPDDAMVDMEASGFFTAASRFTCLELIQSLKVISDNRQHPPTRMKSKNIEALFEPHMATTEQFSQKLLALRHTLDDPIHHDFQSLLEQHHFSTYQQHSLRRLLQRYQALYPTEVVMQALPTSSAKAVIQWLNDEIQRAPVTY